MPCTPPSDHPVGSGTDVEVDRRRVWIVVLQKVEKLGAEFERLFLLEPDCLIDREIEVFDARQPYRATARRRSEAAERTLDKRGGIEPSRPCLLIAGQVAVRQLRALSSTRREAASKRDVVQQRLHEALRDIGPLIERSPRM